MRFNFMENIRKILLRGAASSMTDKEILEMEIAKWKRSPQRKAMITGALYYEGQHDILKRKRQVIGPGGALQEVDNLPNNRIVDNQYAKMVDQKVNYLLGKPLTFDTKNKDYAKALNEVLGMRFHRTLKNVGEDALNGAVAWLHPYYDDAGEFRFKRFEPFEILPFWRDSDHTELEFGLRLYEVETYDA